MKHNNPFSDLDECVESVRTGNPVCSGNDLCKNSDGGWHCVCPSGTFLNPPWCDSTLKSD